MEWMESTDEWIARFSTHSTALYTLKCSLYTLKKIEHIGNFFKIFQSFFFRLDVPPISRWSVTHTDEDVGGASHLRLLNGLRP